MEICAIGKEEFTLGFGLVGIKTFRPEEIKTMPRDQFGVIITDEDTMNGLDEYTRKDYEESLKPLFVILSTQHSQESLNRLIKRSIGIEL